MLKPWFLNLLLVVALVAAAGRFVDVIGQRSDPVPDVAPVAPAAKVPALTRPQTQIAEFQDVVDKNLFDADRGKAEPAAPAPAPAPLPVAQPPQASLFGIMVDPDGNKFAFLTDNRAGQGAKAKRYREGESLSGAKIKEIRQDRVIFTVGSSEHVIALRAPKEGLPNLQSPPGTSGETSLPAVNRRPRSRRTPAPGQQPPSRRPAPVRRPAAPDAGNRGSQGAWDAGENPFAEDPFGDNPFEENPFVDNPFEDNPFEENPFEENPFGENPFEENPFGEGEEW